MKTNTRAIRVKAGSLTLGPTAIKNGETLCDYCGAFEFCTLDKTATACNKLIPPMLFTNPVGLEGAFSTLRLGRAWIERLRYTRHLTLFDVNRNEIIGYAKVNDVVSGNLGDVIAFSADSNHTLIGVDVEDKPAALRKIIRNHYGNNYAADDRPATAIYCERINGKEYSRLKKTWTLAGKRRRRGDTADR